jgi:hypothetical protein
MSRDGLPSSFDAWLTNNPYEQDDAPECKVCGECMEWEEGGDEDGPCGRWVCPNEEDHE